MNFFRNHLFLEAERESVYDVYFTLSDIDKDTTDGPFDKDFTYYLYGILSVNYSFENYPDCFNECIILGYSLCI